MSPHRKEKNLGPPFVVSLLVHIAVLIVGARLHLFTAGALSTAPVYYVDVVNLPVANPQAGSASGGGGGAPEQPASPPPPAPPAMKLPMKAPPAKSAKAPAPAAPTTSPRRKGESSKEFDERLARLERDAEARRQAAVMEALQKKVAGKGGGTGTSGAPGRAGAPGGTGTQAGSYYDTYIRSRLEDAFQVEDTFKPDQSKVVAVRITIGRTGKITALQVERTSNDKMFNDAVMRTITRAERDFPPTPTGGPVELRFVFKPQQVGKQ